MKRLIFAIALLSTLTFSCKKHAPPAPALGRATNLSPTDQQPCAPSGFVNDTTGMITFTWSSVSGASGYILHLKNLLTHQPDSISASGTTLQVPLRLGSPYGWYVVALRSGTNERTTSDNTTFYVAGNGNTTYAPFPAALISPTYGQLVDAGTTGFNLTWKGSDVQNVKLKYTVYMSTSATPAKYASGISDMFLNNVSVLPGLTYYWQVETIDPSGNTSFSEIYQFTTRE